MAWAGNFVDFDQRNASPPSQKYRQNTAYRGTSESFGASYRQNIQNQPPNYDGITKLENLFVGANGCNVAGMVISKEAPKSILSKKNPGSERHLLNFILRDSPQYYVNVTCWGHENYIKDIDRVVGIGFLVKLGNVQVQGKSEYGNDEKYRARTPVNFNISVSENHSQVSPYTGPEEEIFLSLLHVPVKDDNDFYSLEDINANGQNLDKEHVNLLAVVKKIGEPKEITTKTGRHTRRCEIKLLDETCPSFPFVLWDSEFIDLAQSWTPLDTVVFLADVKVTFDDFRQGMIATADSKTIITVNPDTLEAHSLYQYAHTQKFEQEESDSVTSDPPLESINDVYKVDDIGHLMEKPPMNRQPIYGSSYAFFTCFDIDGNPEQLVRFKCVKCRRLVTEATRFNCTNVECGQGALNMFAGAVTTDNETPYTCDYSVNVNLSDHTGTVEHCRLASHVCEDMLKTKAEEFPMASPANQTDLKWKYLLEQKKVYFKILFTYKDTWKPFISIIGLKDMNYQEASKHL